MARSELNSKRWQLLRLHVFERDNWRCVECSKAGRLECDHIVPMHKGGDTWDMSNLQTLCRACHFAKSSDENRKVPLTEDDLEWRELVNSTT